ncbi:MAG: 1-acyl-sn-glycerol-3-phosphate acyltransferase [Clostridia bacterium]|nr:1-acyl-sn-glycerol-3-phosphate acyltransferase [Clostridia bacterium]
MDKTTIPVFYACDDVFAKYAAVSIYSLKKNASRLHTYNIHILHTGMSDEARKTLLWLADANFNIIFDDVNEYISTVSEKLPVRDYYSVTTYYRFFIAEMHPEYDKAIYIDCDTIVQGDISELYALELGNNLLAACADKIVADVDTFGEYTERVLGIPRAEYFQAGMLLINCDKFRIGYVLDRFVQLLHTYDFIVAQDQDYLNVICRGRVLFIDQRWNTETVGTFPFPVSEAKIIHYNMANKPWHYRDCLYAGIFWRCAGETPVFEKLLREQEEYTDAERERDSRVGGELIALARQEIDREDNYLKTAANANCAPDRVEILQKIEEYERAGRFDEDVEDDPPGRELLPDEIDYFRRSRREKLKTKFAFMIARRFVKNLIEEKKLIIKEIKGIENFNSLKGGAVITCNHFNAFDSFAIQIAYEASNKTDRNFYRVIKEGNYTSFPGFYGFLMRHCNTLPLSSNMRTLTKFMEATNELLREGNYVLVYPEQSMWWNYRKPKPLKTGAYIIAARNNVPVLPCFITMADSDVMGEDGFYVQEYTIHIGEPICPDQSLPYRARVEAMLEKNFEIWRGIYEREYGIRLEYSTADKSKAGV